MDSITLKNVVLVLTAVAIVVYLVKKVRGKKRLVSNNEKDIVSRSISTPTIPQPSKPRMVQKSARVAFIENIDRFNNLFPTLVDGTFNASEWTDLIIDINNDELTQIWTKVHKSVDSWVRILASWGVKSDNCNMFKAMEHHKSMYKLSTGDELEVCCSYKVMQGCWIITTENDKRVLFWGKVEKV